MPSDSMQTLPNTNQVQSVLGDITNKQSTSTKRNSVQLSPFQSTSPKHAIPINNNVPLANAIIGSEKRRFPNKRKSSIVASDESKNDGYASPAKTVHKRFKPSLPNEPRESQVMPSDAMQTLHNTKQVQSVLGDNTNIQSTSTKQNTVQLSPLQSTSPKHAKRNCPAPKKAVEKKSVLSKYPTPRKMSDTKPSPKKMRASPVLRNEEEVSNTNSPLRISESEKPCRDLSRATGVARAGPETLALIKAQQAKVNQVTLACSSKVAVEEFDLDFGVSNEELDLDFSVSNDAETANPAVDAAVEVENLLMDEESDLVFDVLNDVEIETTADVDAKCSEGTVVGNGFPEPPQATAAAAEVDFGVIDNVEAEPTADVDAAVEVEVEAPPIVQPRVATRPVRMMRVSIML
jgi:hypothetical protein